MENIQFKSKNNYVAIIVVLLSRYHYRGNIDKKQRRDKNSLCGSCGKAISVLGKMKPLPTARAIHFTRD